MTSYTPRPLRIGPIELGAPVVLAPMAGVTNPPFRRLCRESGEAGLSAERRADVALEVSAEAARASESPGGARGDAASAETTVTTVSSPVAPAGLYVCEMVTSRALVERTPPTMHMIEADPGDPVRSIQLYGVEPTTLAEATRILVAEDRADHIDLNFGCPVPKVTRKGGGAALPWKLDLLESILHATVDAARSASREGGRPFEVPVTMKMRMGIDDDHLTFLDAARIAQRAGVAAVALHARTLEQHYSGHARWEAIGELRRALPDVPVLGNGDIWSAEDALEMMAVTGCDGVVVGRGCQGRPWLFTDLVAAMSPDGVGDVRVRPGMRDVARAMLAHATLMVDFFGDELRALREMRKHMAWYLKGYAVGGEARHGLGLVESLADLEAKLGALDLDQPYPGDGAEGPRGRAGTPKQAHLPHRWLEGRDVDESFRQVLAAAEIDVSGG